MLTSVLAEALMVVLGMGVKVATLPVIALGVGIGVDYALYILSVTLARVAREARACLRPTTARCCSPAKWWSLTGVTLGDRRGDLGASRPSSSRPTWVCCWRSCSCGTCSAR